MSRYDHKIETSLEGIELEIDVGTPLEIRDSWKIDRESLVSYMKEPIIHPRFLCQEVTQRSSSWKLQKLRQTNNHQIPMERKDRWIAKI